MKWEKVELLDRLDAYDEDWSIISEDGRYSGIGVYSCDELVEVEHIHDREVIA